MKKSLFVIAAIAIVFAFTSCNKENSYTGKYKGTYTFFKQNGSVSNPDSTKSGKTVPVLQISDNTVMLYDVIPLYSTSDGMYKTSEMQGEMLTSLLQMAGVGQTAAEAISNVKVTADFAQKNTLMFKMTYDVEIYGVGIEVRILQFDGEKQ
ncbi:MAG: hypothetical protein J6X01_07500 [Bacteroidales bacterium]|jgi:hypothetical protein|nr:hypothetical protein [Bacteroidales bacterium]